MYLPEIKEQVSQGDVFNGLVYRFVFQDPSKSEPEIRSRTICGIVLTYDCEYDKPACTYVYVGEVRPIEEISSNTRGNVSSFKVAANFPLERSDDRLEQSYVDFRRIYRFEKASLEQYRMNHQRVLSLTETAVLALQDQLSRYFGSGRSREHEERQSVEQQTP